MTQIAQTVVELTFEDLYKRFGDVQVLKGVSGKITSGKVSAFVGPNGAGKTTLFQLLTGELQPDRGLVRWNGENYRGRRPAELARNGIGKLFQDVRVFRNLSLLDNVIVAITARRQRARRFMLRSLVEQGNSQQLVDEARGYLGQVGLDAPIDAMARELSWGNQKLLAFARLLAGEFRCVFLDEPIAGISPKVAKRMENLIRDLANSGVAVALIEHELSFVESLANEIVVLNEGLVVDSGTPQEVLSHAETRELCLGL